MSDKLIPIFYACDDNFVKYTIVSLHSIIKNSSTDYKYEIHILHTEISGEMKEHLQDLENECFTLVFDDVTENLANIAEKLPLRDYYSKTTYYRLFIAEMYPQYDKAIYIDSDTIVQGDISKLYFTDIGDAYLGACHDQAMVQINEYGTYVEKVIGISRYNFFNAGVLLINCEQFRIRYILDKFLQLLHVYNFVVTQDEDYLNLICKDHVYWLDQRWNTMMLGKIAYPIEEACIIHYIMTSKPWHYYDCRHGEIFWKYAEETSVYDQIKKVLESYTDEERKRDYESGERLLQTAIKETNRDDNYLNRLNRQNRAKDRVAILRKIEEYERLGKFDVDVEDDPPGQILLPDDIDYLKRGLIKRMKTRIAFKTARNFVNRLIKEKKLIIKEICGIENFKNLESGAVITCNHFNAFDSFIIQLAYEAAEQPNRRFYRVIKEGNYTSFPGFYGFLMRNCDTLPLSSNFKTMKKFMDATNKLLCEGNFVLVYPEQSMWWNYRKPKPLKEGAFRFAAKNNVPVLPCFITMKDSDIIGEDGFYVQEYTIHISEAIYPNPDFSYRENIKNMLDTNYAVWKEIYERVYGIPLVYETKSTVDKCVNINKK